MSSFNLAGLKHIYAGKGTTEAIVYFRGEKLWPLDSTSGLHVAFAVVEDISGYTDRTYNKVYNKADSSWYFLNDLDNYEKYGVVNTVNSLDKVTTAETVYPYSVNLTSSGSWVESDKNPDPSLYYGYMSNGSHNVDNGFDIMTLKISGMKSFYIYVRSYAESIYDYAVVGNIDSPVPISNTDSGGSNVKAHTKGNQQSSTAVTAYTKVEFTDLDPSQEHTIWIEYRKDSSSNVGDDRGYVLVPKDEINNITINGTPSYEGKLVVLSTNNHEYKYTNGQWVDQGNVSVSGSTVTYPTEYTTLDVPAASLTFSTLDEANSYTGDVYYGEVAIINGAFNILTNVDDTPTWKQSENAIVFYDESRPTLLKQYPMNDNGINYGSDSTDKWWKVIYPNSYTGNTLNVRNVKYLHVPKDWASRQTDMHGSFKDCGKLVNIDTKDWDTSNVTNMYEMFTHSYSLVSLDLSTWNVSKVTNMQSMFNMFGVNASLKSLNLSGWDASNVTNMQSMFNGCSKLTDLDISGWNTSNVTNMQSMFNGCSKLTDLDLSSLDTNNVTTMEHMFNGCSSLRTLNVSRWDVSNVTSMYNMFYRCSNLKTVYVRADMLDKWKNGNTGIASNDYFKVKA